MNSERLKSLAISDSGFIFDPSSGNTYNTNATGIKIINYLKEKKDINEIFDLFMEQYDVSSDEVEFDINDFIENLKNYHLVSNI